jgi:hypothetical protein
MNHMNLMNQITPLVHEQALAHIKATFKAAMDADDDADADDGDEEGGRGAVWAAEAEEHRQAVRAWAADQFKSLRQDMVVQHVGVHAPSTLPVRVYETHARVSLEAGDLGAFNQCAARLRHLHASPLGREVGPPLTSSTRAASSS